MSKVKIGMIGVGGMGELHIKAIQELEHAELTAVYDIEFDRAKEISDTYGAIAYASEIEMLDSGKIDALYICTPPFARGSIEIEAVKRGIHLLSEKPVGLDMNTVHNIEKAIADAGVINSSGYCLRYLETVQKAKAYLAGKQINLVLAYRIGGMPPAKWWKLQEKSGGMIVEQATHQVDLVRYLAGEFVQIQSFNAQRSIQKIDPDATIADVGVTSFTLSSGAVGSFMNTCISPHMRRGDVEIIGPDYYLSIKGHTLVIKDDKQDITETCDTDYILEQDRAFIEAVRTGRQDLVLGSFAEAAATLKATLAFNESGESGA